MDSPQKRVGSTMDADCKTTPLLPASVTAAKKATASRPTPFPDAVRLVSIWALSTACFFLVSFAISCAVAYALDQVTTPIRLRTYLISLGCRTFPPIQVRVRLPCVCAEPTDADGDDFIALVYLPAAQAAAAALALLLPGRHRRALACLALAVAIVGHYMLVAGALRLLFAPVADPGQGYMVALDILARIGWVVGIVIFPAGDLVSFLFLALSFCASGK
ncbi:hypothetical protein CFC21_064093 [Triticum aestivum]|uniref:Uncharacterized protein n=2 Tax=Triticum aestivum TaxID=4565 RepID=A0A3B6K9Z2_WHEAT|nr:uncharacterized protein LOC123106452 [Triticum aestivum]KAF7056713.1 hypothetical protein CFC21_064093 [Triticum aestivum]